MSKAFYILTFVALVSSFSFGQQVTGTNQSKVGLLITKVEPGSVYEKLGLKTGDTIQSYNGAPLQNEKDLDGLIKVIEKAGTVRLKVQRKGKVEEFTYNITPK